jgi:hypothetical protein
VSIALKPNLSVLFAAQHYTAGVMHVGSEYQEVHSLYDPQDSLLSEDGDQCVHISKARRLDGRSTRLTAGTAPQVNYCELSDVESSGMPSTLPPSLTFARHKSVNDLLYSPCTAPLCRRCAQVQTYMLHMTNSTTLPSAVSRVFNLVLVIRQSCRIQDGCSSILFKAQKQKRWLLRQMHPN